MIGRPPIRLHSRCPGDTSLKFSGRFFRIGLNLAPEVEARAEEAPRENQTSPALEYSMWFTVFSVFLWFFLIRLLRGAEVLKGSWNISLTFDYSQN